MPTAADTVPRRTAAGGPLASARDIPDIVRLGYLTTVLVSLFSHSWFVDLSDRSMLGDVESGSLVTQVSFATLALVTVPLLLHLGLRRLRPLATMPMLLFGGWLCITTVLSSDLLLSLRRIALYVIVVLLVSALLVVARSARQFATAVALAAATVLAASYFGVLFLSGLSIHSAYDLSGESNHIGLWRGIFSHKNEAGIVMTILVLCGLYVAAAKNRWLGWAIVVAALLFLLGTGSKTPLAGLAIVMMVSWLCGILRSPIARAVLLVGPVALMSLATIGAVLSSAVRRICETVLPDATFTARNEIWAFAIDNIATHPLKGWGFGAFWLSERTVYGSVAQVDSDWVQSATQAHNSFLDAALIMGLPGLALTVAVFVIRPALDFQRSSAAGGIDPSTELFLRLWQLCVVTASFESILFNPNTAACAMTLLGVFGLRMRTARPVIA